MSAFRRLKSQLESGSLSDLGAAPMSVAGLIVTPAPHVTKGSRLPKLWKGRFLRRYLRLKPYERYQSS